MTVDTSSLRILMIITSHGDLSGQRATGFYASEAAEAWLVLTQAGYTVDVVTVSGGTPPVDARDLDDPTQRRFFAAVDLARLPGLQDLPEAQIVGYRAVFLPGGHGTMWDFPHPEVGAVVTSVWAAGGAVGAVCHGSAGLLSAHDTSGAPFVAGRHVTGFSNSEETAAGTRSAVPFLLADELRAQGASYTAGDDFTTHVVTDGRLVTGQNPASTYATAHALLDVLAAPRADAPHDPSSLVWLVTGASTGFGRSIAVEAARRGDRVMATARRPEALQEISTGDAHLATARLDVIDTASIRAACDQTLERFGRIDVLVNNAGYGLRGAVEEWDLDALQAQWATNVIGPALALRAVLPTMRTQRSGWIVQMSSVGGVSATLGGTAYATSKFALEGLSEGVAAEVGPFGIDVTLIEPGPFRTDFAGRSTRWSPETPTYRDILAPAYAAFRQQDGQQPNSPERAAEIIVDLAHAPARPLRLPMGPEAFDRIRTVLTERLTALPNLEQLARDTSYPEATI